MSTDIRVSKTMETIIAFSFGLLISSVAVVVFGIICTLVPVYEEPGELIITIGVIFAGICLLILLSSVTMIAVRNRRRA
ncbi:MAG: hypothetical protein PHD25_12535 [Bacteroidales bacterium]|nr:hypothetical protein [Bacteroidales bacterium]